MSARISRDFDFVSGVCFENEFFMNVYDVGLHFTVETESIEEQNIALERIKYFLQDCIENSVFIHEQDVENIEKMAHADMRLCLLPEEPYDQIIGIMLLVKINAITEGRLIATDIDITSRLSDGVACLYSVDDNSGPFVLKGWWNDSSPKFTSTLPKVKGKKVVKLTRAASTWDELSLGWASKPIESITNEVVFVSFDKLDK